MFVVLFLARYQTWWMQMHQWRQFSQCLLLIPPTLGQAQMELLVLGSKQELGHDPAPKQHPAFRMHRSLAWPVLLLQTELSRPNRTRAKSRQRGRTRPSTSWGNCLSREIREWRLWLQSSNISSLRYFSYFYLYQTVKNYTKMQARSTLYSCETNEYGNRPVLLLVIVFCYLGLRSLKYSKCCLVAKQAMQESAHTLHIEQDANVTKQWFLLEWN